MDRIDSIQLTFSATSTTTSEIIIPASKSISNRLLVIKKLTDKSLHIENLSDAHDTKVFKRALSGPGELKDLGAAGTAMRFGIAWACVTPGIRLLTGDERLRQRPVQPLVEALSSLGANIEYLESPGYPPLRISGGILKGGNVSISGEMSSQFISALMLIGPVMDAGLEIYITGTIVSRPYVQMTAHLMRQFGAEVSFPDENKIRVAPGNYSEGTATVEADWSAASYFFSWVALNPSAVVHLQGLNENSIQGDSILPKLFTDFGVLSDFSQNGLTLSNTGKVTVPAEIDCTEFPDLAQTLACTAAGLNQPLKLTGLQTLPVKETDRIKAMATELLKLGVNCTYDDRVLELVEYKAPPKLPVEIDTYNDHRMAMSFAPLVCKFSTLKIKNPEVVGKSFPDFWEEISKLGVKINFTEASDPTP